MAICLFSTPKFFWNKACGVECDGDGAANWRLFLRFELHGRSGGSRRCVMFFSLCLWNQLWPFALRQSLTSPVGSSLQLHQLWSSVRLRSDEASSSDLLNLQLTEGLSVAGQVGAMRMNMCVMSTNGSPLRVDTDTACLGWVKVLSHGGQVAALHRSEWTFHHAQPTWKTWERIAVIEHLFTRLQTTFILAKVEIELERVVFRADCDSFSHFFDQVYSYPKTLLTSFGFSNHWVPLGRRWSRPIPSGTKAACWTQVTPCQVPETQSGAVTVTHCMSLYSNNIQ